MRYSKQVADVNMSTISHLPKKGSARWKFSRKGRLRIVRGFVPRLYNVDLLCLISIGNERSRSQFVQDQTVTKIYRGQRNAHQVNTRCLILNDVTSIHG